MDFKTRLRVSIGALASAALLVLGLFVVPWFTSAESPEGASADEMAKGTARIKLLDTEVCHDHGTVCATGLTTDVVDGISGYLALATVGVGCLFGLAMLDADRRHNLGNEARWSRTVIIGALGLTALALAAICLLTFAPDGINYVIRDVGPSTRYTSPTDHSGFTETPTRAAGGWLVLAGLGLALYMTWRARPERADEAVAEVVATAPRPPRRAPIDAPPRGVETDPFRAPPAPPPIAVVKPSAAAATAPRADRDDEPGPALLR